MSVGRWRMSADQIAVGVTLIAVGVGGEVQGWPLVPSMLIGWGAGTLLAGLWNAVRGEPR